MKKKEFTIVFIDDLIPDNDPIKLKVEKDYKEYKLFKLPKDGVKYLKENYKNKQIIVIIEYLFASISNLSGKWILNEIRKFSNNIPVILYTSVENQIIEYKDLINLNIFRVANKGDYIELLKIIELAENIYFTKDKYISKMEEMIYEQERKNQTKNISTNIHYSFEKEINTHFTEIDIINLKSLQNIKFSNLNKINLIAGRNNSGKTTLLEAVYLLCKQNDFNEFIELQRMRGKFPQINDISNNYLKLFIPELTEIKGVYENKETSIFIKKEQITPENDSLNYVTTFNFESFVENDFIIDNNANLKTSAEIFGNKFSFNLNKLTYTKIRNLCKIEFYSPFIYQVHEKLEQAYNKSILNNNFDKIVNFIKEIEPIEKIEPLIEEKSLRFVATINGKKRELTQFGDGLQRIFAISLQFAACENGVLLIDELENAIDFKSIEKFSGFIIDLAELFNVQVFITSHSKECINSFFNENTTDKISAYTISRKDNIVQCKYVDGKVYKRLIESINADLSRAK